MKPQDDTKFVPGNKNDIGGRKEKTPIDADGIKIAAGAVAGVAIGGGAAYAASEFLGGDAVEAEAKTAEVPKVDSEAKQTKATNAEEAKVDANAKEHIEQHRISPQEQFYKDNEVKINTIETTTDASGQVRHVASGTVDGHQAVFVDDGQGNAVEVPADKRNRVVTVRDNACGNSQSRQVQAAGIGRHKITDTAPQAVQEIGRAVSVDVERF